MGLSIVILAFALDDADRVMGGFDWRATTHQVGVPVDMAAVAIEDLVNPKRQKANNPHFSAERGPEYFFVYTPLKRNGQGVYSDFALLSATSPPTAYIVVERSNAATVERWECGQVVRSVGGASGTACETSGDTPVNLVVLTDDHRVWWSNLPHDYEAGGEPGEFDLPQDNRAITVDQFSSLLDDWFADETGVCYVGDHPHMFRVTGDLPVSDIREARRD